MILALAMALAASGRQLASEMVGTIHGTPPEGETFLGRIQWTIEEATDRAGDIPHLTRRKTYEVVAKSIPNFGCMK